MKLSHFALLTSTTAALLAFAPLQVIAVSGPFAAQPASKAPHLAVTASATPIAAYGFGEGQGSSTADSSANHLNGVVSTATWVSGKFGKALRFSGQSSSRVTVADTPLLRLTTAFTLSAWVNPQASQPTEPTIIFKQNPGDLAYVLYAKGAGVGPNAFTKMAGSYQSVVAPNLIPASTWTHLASTFDGSTLRIYVNGNLVSSAAASGTLDTGSGPLRIGNNSIFPNEGFIGIIDEVRIYDRAQSAAELLSDMATAVSETPPVDTTPPNGTIQINAGAVSTNQSNVTLTLAASDASGVAQMRFSNDNLSFSAALAFATSAPWILTSGDGSKTVYVQYKDTPGNWSNAISANITLDSVAPTVSSVTATSITAFSSTISWTTNEAATSLVDYGTTNAYGQSTPVNTALTLAHTVGLSGLSPATLYHYRVRSADAAGNASNGNDATFTTPTPSSTTPVLGAHVLYTQDEQQGFSPAVTPAITTQTSGSTLIALSMGWVSNFAAPTDSYSNSWAQLSAKNIYAGVDFYTALWTVPSAIGGMGHTLSFNKPGHDSGEISMSLIEVVNGGHVEAAFRLAPESNQTPGTITTTGPATLIAIWGGDAWGLSHTAVPDNGFVVIDSYLNLGPASGVQVAIATKQVTQAGTYSVNWTSTPLQNCACYLIAVQDPR